MKQFRTAVAEASTASLQRMDIRRDDNSVFNGASGLWSSALNGSRLSPDYFLMRANLVPYFDSTFYLSQYDDVRAQGGDPLDHYLIHGWKEGRKPTSGFDTAFYLKANEDVRRSGLNPFYHYLVLGKSQGRLPIPPDDVVYEVPKDGADSGSDHAYVREIVEIYFDAQFYLCEYEDIRRDGVDALEHFLSIGWKEGRNPTAEFDTQAYLERYEDVRRAGINPFYHYLVAGKSEGRFAIKLSAPTMSNAPPPSSTGDDAFVREVMAQHFDSEFYLGSYEDVRRAGVDPLDHYLWTGWMEGRNPTRNFDTAFYLRENEDVRRAGLNPFYHYLVAGKTEGRLSAPRAPVASPSSGSPKAEAKPAQDAVDGFVRQAVAAHFDREYYLDLYGDIRHAGIDPLEHYLVQGWKEGRNPSWHFNTNFYLDSYPDVRDAGINPFYHFIAAGRGEGRVGRDALAMEVSVLGGCGSAREKSRTWIRSDLPKALPAKKLAQLLAQRLLERATGDCFAVSHDGYLNVTGGIQICLSDEQKLFNELGYNYFHIFPTQPLPMLSDYTSQNQMLVTLTANGHQVGTALMSTVSEVLKAPIQKHVKQSKKKDAQPRALMVLHSLLGHSPEAIAGIAKALNIQSTYFWVHDYFSLCESYALLRNDLSFCHAPAPVSQACAVCCYGKERASHQARIIALFQKLAPVVISPSQAALAIWQKSPLRTSASAEIVLPHCEIVETKAKSRVGSLKSAMAAESSIKVGFVGFDKYHKGWSVFERLASNFSGDKRYTFHHLGNRQARHPSVDFTQIDVNQKSRNGMIEAIVGHALDVILIWPQWPETFSFVTYEAMAAGALVITNKDSGNVAATVDRLNSGLILESEEALQKVFKTGELLKLCVGRDRYRHKRMRLKYSGCTASLFAVEGQDIK